MTTAPLEAAALALLQVGHAQHHGRGAQRAGVQAQAVALAQVAVEQLAVDQALRPGDRVLLVVRRP